MDARPTNVGIVAMELYVPSAFIDQVELEKHDKCGTGKYTIGLGQLKMGFPSDCEDIHSICLTVVQNLVEKYGIDYKDIGRLEVGTETIIDKSKAVKTVLMKLFEDSGNTNVEGLDTTNACYGGTNALFNSINWIESSAWDGRYAMVVCGDIAVYAKGPARPTGGCGALAILMGKDAPLVLEPGLRVSHFEHTYDFFKPDLASEYPRVDGQQSAQCYLRALDMCYARYRERFEKKVGEPFSLDSFAYGCFHNPYNKLVQKSVARLVYDEFRQHPDRPEFARLVEFKDVPLADTYSHKALETTCMELSRTLYDEKFLPTTLISKQSGNIYTGAVYASVLSLLSEKPSSELRGKRLLLFSYGSGLASSMFSVVVRGDTSDIAIKADVKRRLEQRREISPAELDAKMEEREHLFGKAPFTPRDNVDDLFPGTYYLTGIDDMHRRTYLRKAAA